MKTINLLPRVPFIIKHRGFLILLTVLLGIVAVGVQSGFIYSWKTAQAASEQARQQTELSIANLTVLTRQTPLTSLYEQGLSRINQVRVGRPNWVSVVETLLGTMNYQGQLTSIQVTEDRLLTMNAIFLSQDEVTACITALEADSRFINMRLQVTEHQIVEENRSLDLLQPTGEKVSLTDQDYYTMQLEISLPMKLE